MFCCRGASAVKYSCFHATGTEMPYKSVTSGGPKKDKLSLKASLMWSNSHLNDLTVIIVVLEHQRRAKLGGLGCLHCVFSFLHVFGLLFVVILVKKECGPFPRWKSSVT